MSRVLGKVAILSLVFLMFAWNAVDTYSPGPTVAQTKLAAAIKAQKAGQFAKAIDLYDEALAARSDKTLALGGKAECLYYLGEDHKALAVCDELAAAVPSCGRANYIRGLVLLRQGHHAKAYAELRWAVTFGDMDAESLLPKGK